jgi:hypothetical protein
MPFTIFNYRGSFAGTYALHRLGNLFSIGGIDIDGICPTQHRQHKQ